MDSATETDAGALHPDFAVMMTDNGLNNEETEATATDIFIFAAGAIEHVEDLADLLAIEPAAAISDHQVGKVSFPLETDRNDRCVVGIKDGIFDEIAQRGLQGLSLAADLQPFFDLQGHRSGAGQRILAGAKVAADQGGEIDGDEVETGAALFEAVGGEEVIDQSAEAFGITEHGIDEDFEFFRRGAAQANRFEMETQRGERRFEFVGHLGDKILLGLVEGDLSPPKMMDGIDADQEEGEEEESFDKDEPVRPGGEDDRAVLLGELAEPPLVADKPDDPGGNQSDPEDLDGDNHHQRRIEGAKKAFHHTCLPLPALVGKKEVLQNYYNKKKSPVVICNKVSKNPCEDFRR